MSGMIKTMMAGDQPGLLDNGPAARLLKITSSGLGSNDYHQLVKSAGYDFANQARLIKPAPGEFPVHLIALGANEAFGFNRNGDAFSKIACEKYHKTFEKYAYYYYHHCFPAGTLVTLADKSKLPIEQVEAGTEVLTRIGSRRVLRTMSNEYDGLAVTIKTDDMFERTGSGTELTGTFTHPVLSFTSGELLDDCDPVYRPMGDLRAWEDWLCVLPTEEVEDPVDYPFVKIQSRHDHNFKGTVYNLEVEEAHHYVANDVIVHNCNKDPRKSRGTVKLAYYNPKMQRIELLIFLNQTKEAAQRNKGLVADDEDFQKIASNKGMSVSMACMVPLDVCSVCGNKARNRSEYCRGIDEGGHCKGGGLKNRITAILEDGTGLYADNPDPKWFDISKVRREADRIAFTLGHFKAASNGRPLSGVELSEKLGVTAPWFVRWDVADSPLLKQAAMLAAIEQELSDTPGEYDLALTSPSRANDFDRGPNAPVIEKLAALTRLEAMLPLEEFLQLSTEPIKAAQVAAQAASLLPGAYQRLMDGTQAKGLVKHRFRLNEVPVGDDVRAWAEKIAADYSLKPECLQRRSLRASLYFRSPPTLKTGIIKLATDVVPSAATDAYLLYQLSFLDFFGNRPDFSLTQNLVVRQNHLNY